MTISYINNIVPKDPLLRDFFGRPGLPDRSVGVFLGRQGRPALPSPKLWGEQMQVVPTSVLTAAG